MRMGSRIAHRHIDRGAEARRAAFRKWLEEHGGAAFVRSTAASGGTQKLLGEMAGVPTNSVGHVIHEMGLWLPRDQSQIESKRSGKRSGKRKEKACRSVPLELQVLLLRIHETHPDIPAAQIVEAALQVLHDPRAPLKRDQADEPAFRQKEAIRDDA